MHSAQIRRTILLSVAVLAGFFIAFAVFPQILFGQEEQGESQAAWEIPESLRDDPSLSDEERENRRQMRELLMKRNDGRGDEGYVERTFIDNFAPQPPEVLAERAKRLEWFEKAYLGMFIHWNPSCFTDMEMSFGRGRMKTEDWERVEKLYGIDLDTTKSSVEIYESLPQHFNPVEFDAAEIVGMAKKMGAQYLVIVNKHHDGFCMFDSKYTEYDIMNTPYGKDITKQIADECHRQGIRLGLYYSLADWYHNTRETSFEEYLQFMYGQWEELLTNYGQVDVFWYDGGGGFKYPYKDMAEFIQHYQPDCLIRNGAWYQKKISRTSDYLSTEYGTPPVPRVKGSGYPVFEWGFPIVHFWNYHSNPGRVIPASNVIQRQLKVVSLGGNCMPNIALSPRGELDEPYRRVLGGLGRFNDKYGDILYDSKPAPRKLNEFSYSLLNDGAFYVFAIQRPDDGNIPLFGLRNPKITVTVVGEGQPLEVKGQGERRFVNVPESAVDEEFGTVVLKIDYEGDLDCSETIHQGLGRPDVGLGTHQATCTDGLEYGVPYKCLRGWSEGARAEWTVYFDQPGEYEIHILYICHDDNAGSKVEFSAAGQGSQWEVAGSGSPRPGYGRETVLTFEVEKPGPQTVSVKMLDQKSDQPWQLRNLTLKKIRAREK